jgi:hypothetical protein
MDFLRNHQKRKANIQETLAEGNEAIFSLSFPNSGGKAVAGHALASPGIPLSCKKELIEGAKARKVYFYFTPFSPIVKKFWVHFQFRREGNYFNARNKGSESQRIRNISDLNKIFKNVRLKTTMEIFRSRKYFWRVKP